MRLIDADELLKEVIGMKDGWFKPPKGVRTLEDLIHIAPTIEILSNTSSKSFDAHKTAVGARIEAGFWD